MATIKFGTDGWRAIVGKDFNSENVGIVTNSIGKYIFDEFGIDKKILIGYDPRNMAKEFAEQSAKLLSECGFNVILSSKIVPTPVLAYSAKLYNACAIMFTASHNPPEYLGMKFIPDYAGPATSEITNKLVENLGQKAPEDKGGIEKFDFFDPYFAHLKKIIDFEKIKTFKGTIIFDGLYSASIGYFDKILDEYNIPYESLHMEHDPNFGGGMPEPKPKYLKELIELVKSFCPPPQPSPLKGGGRTLRPSITGAVGFANDGDGDRFGVINENGEYVTPNEIIAILLLYLKQYKKINGTLVKTVGASLLLDKVAEKIGVEVIETAVGFKHVGEAMRKFNPIIGGEESGGLSIQGHIPEKDGILANLLVIEAMASNNKTLVELQERLYEFAGAKFYNERVDLKLENQDQIKKALDNAKEMKKVGEYSVIKTDLKDGVKLYLDDTTSWILIRPSGTEPLLRIYFESDSLEKIAELKKQLNNVSY